MVSGIGPEATLQSLNIPVLANIPGVGQNFQVRMPFRSLHFNFFLILSLLNINSILTGSTRLWNWLACERYHSTSIMEQRYIRSRSRKSLYNRSIRAPNSFCQ